MSIGWGCDEGYTEIDGECYYQGDLDVLQNFIDLNQSLNEEEPLEIGDQGWNNTRLTYLGLGNRSLTTIPDNIGNLNHLEYLFLSSNQFSILPEGIGNLSSLKYLFLSYNQFIILPDTIGELSSLESLYLNSNQLFILPDTICNLPGNSYIYFDNNQLCPPYLECLSENGWLLGYQDTSNCEETEPSICTGLTEVELWGEWYDIESTNYINLYLWEQGLTNSIPPEIGCLTNLTYLYLESNQLTGDIPPEIGNLTNLEYLYLTDNQITGEIPPEIGNLTNLTSLYLSYNHLTGEIPSEIGTLTNLYVLDLSYNQFTGEIPIEICNQGDSTPTLYNNNLCPPYPECLSEEDIGYQDTSNCEEECPDSIGGDLNYDGIVNILDVVTLVTCVLSDNRCDICFDINYDGEINVIDIVSLVNIILDI